ELLEAARLASGREGEPVLRMCGEADLKKMARRVRRRRLRGPGNFILGISPLCEKLLIAGTHGFSIGGAQSLRAGVTKRDLKEKGGRSAFRVGRWRDGEQAGDFEGGADVVVVAGEAY